MKYDNKMLFRIAHERTQEYTISSAGIDVEYYKE